VYGRGWTGHQNPLPANGYDRFNRRNPQGVVEGMTFELDEQAERVTEGAPLLRKLALRKFFTAGTPIASPA